MHLLLDGPITFDNAELTPFGLVSQYRNTPAWRLKIEMLGEKKIWILNSSRVTQSNFSACYQLSFQNEHFWLGKRHQKNNMAGYIPSSAQTGRFTLAILHVLQASIRCEAVHIPNQMAYRDKKYIIPQSCTVHSFMLFVTSPQISPLGSVQHDYF